MAKQFVCKYDYPVVETKAGKLRGYLEDGIFVFQGVEYAYADRFKAPQPVEPWEGIKSATNYGYICPTMGEPAPSSEVYIPHRFWPANEHCQNLNVWTPGINDGRKRPVMVWFHGGGFANGSSIEQVAYEGDKLAKYGDVVVVTVNHRLNILGYLDMSAYGEEYKNSVNAGIADLVASLQWVHDNIAAFGGDPDNVTIFGQSGGGSKVQSMLQAPAAAGLFHKAIIMSGIMPKSTFKPPIDQKKITDVMLSKLGIAPENIAEIEDVPYDVMVRAYDAACQETGLSVNWGPQANYWYPGDPMQAGFSDYAKTVPVIAGSTVAELGMKATQRDNQLTEDQVLEIVKNTFGDAADDVIAEFHKTFPDKRLALLNAYDAVVRPAVVEFMEQRASETDVPGYMYNFTLEFPVEGGAFAWHCADIPWFFHNTERVGNCNIEGVTERLEEEMAGAWVAFAYTGNPNHKGLAKWAPVGKDKETMYFDTESVCVANRDTALIDKIVDAIHPVFGGGSAVKDEKGKEKREWMY